MSSIFKASMTQEKTEGLRAKCSKFRVLGALNPKAQTQIPKSRTETLTLNPETLFSFMQRFRKLARARTDFTFQVQTHKPVPQDSDTSLDGFRLSGRT